MALPPPPMQSCCKKQRCLTGVNIGQVYDVCDPCQGIGDFDAALCDCISDNQYEFIRYWVWAAHRRDRQLCPNAPPGTPSGSTQFVQLYDPAEFFDAKEVSFQGRDHFQRLDIECCASDDPFESEWMFTRRYTDTDTDDLIEQNTINAVVYEGCRTGGLGLFGTSEQLYVTYGIYKLQYILKGEPGLQTYIDVPPPTDYDSAETNLPLFLP